MRNRLRRRSQQSMHTNMVLMLVRNRIQEMIDERRRGERSERGEACQILTDVEISERSEQEEGQQGGQGH